MAVLATSGVVMVGAAGQTILIAFGWSAGWIKTTTMLSPDALIVPLARGVVG
jgi:hypothetical protein